MNRNKKTLDPSVCVHCHVCRQNCVFLDRYELDIGDTERLKELAMHCFLCGRCTQVCPKDIDGRGVILEIRRQAVQENKGRLKDKGYGLLLWEKKDYRFRNYKNVRAKSVLFPGCNFPSLYPKTTRYLVDLLRNEAGMGIVFDCCGKPVGELGLVKEEERILTELNERLDRLGIEEVVILCPNCYHFLKERLQVKVTNIYSKLSQLGLGRKIPSSLMVFSPCPDREEGEILKSICFFMEENPSVYSHVQCCGLGGCAGIKEPELAVSMTEALDRAETIYTFCASCSGALTKKGYRTEHLLLKILEREEEPDVRRSLLNRVKSAYWRET